MSGVPNARDWRANWFNLKESLRSWRWTFFYLCTIALSLLLA